MPNSPEDKTTFRLRLRRRLHRQLRLLTLWPLAVIIALSLVLIGMIAYLFHSAEQVDHSHEVLTQISRMEILVVEMESDVRGYRIVGDRALLESFERSLAAFPAQLDALAALVRDHPRQGIEVSRMLDAFNAWNEAATLMRERGAAGLPLDIPLQNRGMSLMSAVRAPMDAMRANEHSLLEERSRLLARVKMLLMPGVLLAGLIFTPLLIISIRRSLAHLDAGYRAAWDETDRERERLDVTLFSIGDAVLATDAQGMVTYLNPVAVALTGWAMHEARGKPFATVFNIIHETTRAPVASPVSQVLRDGATVALTLHTLLLAKGGREIPIADSAAPIHDNDGQITGVVMVFRDQTEEREAEKRLRESEARKAAILNSSLDAILGMDAGGMIVEFNPAAETIFGHRAGDVIGRPLADVIIPERLRAAHNRGLAHYLATGVGPVLNRRVELSAVRADGTEFPVELAIHRIPGIEPPRFSGFIRDITELQRAQAAVAEKTRLLDLTTDAIVIRDVGGRIAFWNDGAEKMYGWSREEALGKTTHDLLKTEFPTTFEDLTAELYRTNHWTGEFVHTTRDGRRITVLARKALDRDSEGNPAAVLQTLTDITERKREEEALARIAAIIDSSNDAILSKDLHSIISSWNAAAERLFGYTAEEAIGQSVTMLIPPDHADEEPYILARIRKGEPIEHYETIRRRKDGTLCDVLLTVSPVMDKQGRIVGASKIVRDITERKRAQKELVDAHAQLADRAVQLETLVEERTSKLSTAHTQLLAEADERKRLEAEIANAAEHERERLGQELHDGLAQELAGIGMLLHVLERQMEKPSPAFASEAGKLCLMLEKAQENARNLAKSFYPVELDQHGLLVALQSYARRTQERFGIRCAVEASEDAPARLKDPTAVQLFRIAQEAVHNATKHAEATEIVIRLGKQDGAWLLTIKDNGVGLPGGAHAASGMGLRIMQYRARMIGGTLDVCNGDGGGVLMSCAVPATEEE